MAPVKPGANFLQTLVDLVESCRICTLKAFHANLVVQYEGPTAVVVKCAQGGLGLRNGVMCYDHVIMVVASIILTRCIWAPITGFSGLAPMYAFLGLFSMTDEVRIQSASSSWPEGPILLSCHHRVPNYMLDMVVQFLVSPKYPNMRVAVAEHVMGHVKWATKYLFHSTHLYETGDKLQQLFNVASATDCLAVFPDYDGSQFPGDLDIFFRPGLFAASMYLQRPIVDFCLLEPTASAPHVLLDIAVWWPPKIRHGAGRQSAAEFREANEAAIQDYTRTCEDDYKRRLQQYEAPRLSCFAHEVEAKCVGRARHNSWARNHKRPYKTLTRTIP